MYRALSKKFARGFFFGPLLLGLPLFVLRYLPLHLGYRVIDTGPRLKLSLEISELCRWTRVTAYRLLLRDYRRIRASDEQECPYREHGGVAKTHACEPLNAADHSAFLSQVSAAAHAS